MSRFVCGNIYPKTKNIFNDSNFIFDIVCFCATNKFAIQFNRYDIEQVNLIKKQNCLSYIISDNFYLTHCEHFIEPIFSSSSFFKDSSLDYQKINTDTNKLKSLFEFILSYDIQKIELYITDGEAYPDEFKECYISIDNFCDFVVNEFYSCIGDTPTIKLTLIKD